MDAKQTLAIGIYIGSGHKPYTFAALDSSLTLEAVGEGQLMDVLAYVLGKPSALLAIGGPLRPGSGLMTDAEVRRSLNPPPAPGRFTRMRVAEYQIQQRGWNIPEIPSTAAECPPWAQRSFDLYENLANSGYQIFDGSDAPRQVLETRPELVFVTLLGQALLPAGTLEGRLQRQLLLTDQDVHLADPMDFFEEITRHRLLHGVLPVKDIHSQAELEAVAAAYAAWLALNHPAQLAFFGDPREGQIALPNAPLPR